MRPIPPGLKTKMIFDPFYEECCLKGINSHECAGRITWEHAIILAGRQLNEIWAILPICERGHAVNQFQDAGTLDKELNLWVALNRATYEELKAISKSTDYQRERSRLNEKYGVYEPKVPTFYSVGSGAHG